LNSIITCSHFNLTLIKQLGCVLHALLCSFLQGLAPHYRLRGSWTQWTATTAATATTITSLKGNWISTHNIAAVIQDSAATRSAQDSAAIRSADEGEGSRYLLGFERDYVEPGPNVNNNLDAPSPQPFPSN
jgi:hypothetical protein